MLRKKLSTRKQNLLQRKAGGRLYFFLVGLAFFITLVFSFGVTGDSLVTSIGNISIGGGGSISIGGGGSVSGGSSSNIQPGCGSGNCLAPPAPAAYSDGIATEDSLKSTILKWVNFFLGFFSLLAMIALIFAGFLYVTSAGNDEQAQKAKKIIIWVVIGIIVVLIAYVLVNSLISFGPKGQEP